MVLFNAFSGRGVCIYIYIYIYTHTHTHTRQCTGNHSVKTSGKKTTPGHENLVWIWIPCYWSKARTLRNPIRQGCGEALSNRSRRSQNSSGSTLVSISSWINVLTFLSTDLGSRLDSSRRFARNFRHFSLVVSTVCRCKTEHSINRFINHLPTFINKGCS